MNPAGIPQVSPVESLEALWGRSLRPTGCPKCGQAHLVQEERLNQLCPNCFSSVSAPQPALLRSEPPELVLPFSIDRRQLEAILIRFTQGVWLHGDDFTPQKLLERAVPVYWPMWLVDGEIEGDWRAEAGFDYQVKSSQESYQSGRWQTHPVVENRIRWEPRLGQLRRRFDNIVTPAASNHGALWSLAGGYQTVKAISYDPGSLNTDFGPAVLRVPDLQPESAWPMAETAFKKAAGEDCRKAAGAQHVRSFAIHAEYDDLHWTQLLLPLVMTYYTDDEGKAQPVYINGSTGTAGGLRLASQRKGWKWAGILAGVGAATLLLGLLITALGMLFPPAAVVGVVVAAAGLLTAALAVFPSAWPWQWNRRQQEGKISTASGSSQG
jgi:hypothetical protein